MTGCNNKRRFTILKPDGCQVHFGSCDPKDDDNYTIENRGDFYALVHIKFDGTMEDAVLFKDGEGYFWTNGYYDKEHDGWKPLSEFI